MTRWESQSLARAVACTRTTDLNPSERAPAAAAPPAHGPLPPRHARTGGAHQSEAVSPELAHGSFREIVTSSPCQSDIVCLSRGTLGFPSSLWRNASPALRLSLRVAGRRLCRRSTQHNHPGEACPECLRLFSCEASLTLPRWDRGWWFKGFRTLRGRPPLCHC